jgi:hypothetical protein
MKEWIYGHRLYETIQLTTHSYIDIYNASTNVLKVWGKWSKKIYDPSTIIDHNSSIVLTDMNPMIEKTNLKDQIKYIPGVMHEHATIQDKQCQHGKK